jgi:hypothetical protein
MKLSLEKQSLEMERKSLSQLIRNMIKEQVQKSKKMCHADKNISCFDNVLFECKQI